MTKILVVEDDENLAMGIEYALQKEGWQTSLVSSASEFNQTYLAELFENKYNLILLDVMLPDGNGFDICKNVRRKSSVPIIFLTACSEEINIVMGLDMGADDYITKPFRTRELISRIKALLRRNTYIPSKQENKLVSEDISLCLLQGKAYKNELELYFTPSEFRLLALLMQNAEITLARNTILNKLWDIDGEFIDDNTLSVYIRRVREKLADSDLDIHKYIVTVRGIGYMWNKRSILL